MTRHRILAALLGATMLASCEKNAVQVLPTADLAGARIKFFNFGVNAPAVNFYVDETKMTAIVSGTQVESNSGVAYGGVGAGGFYTAVAPGQHAVTGRIAALVDKNLPIATVAATIDDGKLYSFYMSGIYNTTTKTVDAFIVEDPVVPPPDFTVAHVRFVNAISNANPLTLFGTIRNLADTTKTDTVTVNAAVAYKSAGAFTALRAGVYNLLLRYPDSTTNKTTLSAVSFLGGRVYTVGARGNIIAGTGATVDTLQSTTNR
jgi:hypothetical protein